MGSGSVRLAMGLVLAGLTAACGSTVPVPTSVAFVPQATVPADCRQRIEQADFLNPSTLFAIDNCRFTPDGESASRAVLESNPTGAPLWAAVWVYGASGSDPAPLRPFAGSSDPSVRVMAASGLAAFGDASGFAVLEQSLSDETLLKGSDPPIAIADFSLGTLNRFVVNAVLPSPAISSDGTADLRTSWAAWLTANESALVFDDEAGTWSIP